MMHQVDQRMLLNLPMTQLSKVLLMKYKKPVEVAGFFIVNSKISRIERITGGCEYEKWGAVTCRSAH